MRVQTQTLGYPYIGRDRELKRALESFWQGQVDGAALLFTLREIEEEGWLRQREAGIDFIGVGDASLYDPVLDWALRFDLVPARFRHLQGLGRYFALARGHAGFPPLELTKWFDTNYHYLIPEVESGLEPRADFNDFVVRVRRAQALLGERAIPILLGPVTLLRLSLLEEPLLEVLLRLLPLYRQLLRQLREEGFVEVQLHEPALVLHDAPLLREAYEVAYASFAESGLRLNLVTYFDDLGEALPWVLALPVQVLTLDFTAGKQREALAQVDWPPDKVLAAGVVEGRNVWRTPAASTLELLHGLGEGRELRVSASSSLRFVPYTTVRETHLPAPLAQALAFADEKLEELARLARAHAGEIALEEDFREGLRAFAPDDPALGDRLSALDEADFSRSEPYATRRPRQISLPPLPTTTIGSFPQTRAVRRLRGQYRRGEIDAATYHAGIEAWIAHAVGVQDALGLDVVTHGEFERSDMVEYFAHQFEGFAFTRHGWVQSYGSRYVRPPIIYADVTRPGPVSVREFAMAQSFTKRPVKGMLTGPVTILNWSFPRTDVHPSRIAYQIALALREEIADLEAAGARVVQVDEPALRERLPFKRERCEDYLTWTVAAFRLATGGARPETQIHTHMCYAEFGDILEAIEHLDADVISLENARSGDEPVRELAETGYRREVGPGVYDVHSPDIPSVEFVIAKLRTFLAHLEPEQIWVNPDCGLKTRRWEEVIPALRTMVEAARRVRETLRRA